MTTQIIELRNILIAAAKVATLVELKTRSGSKKNRAANAAWRAAHSALMATYRKG